MAIEDTGTRPPRPGENAGTRPPRAGDAGRPYGTDPARLVGDERLPCGRLVSDAWDQARHLGGPDPHTARCPYCRQATEGLAALDRATRSLTAWRPSTRAVAERVVSAVRAETRLGALVPLDDPARELRIAEITAAKVLRSAADRVDGVRAAGCRLTPRRDGTTVDIAMTLAAALDRPLPGRGAEARRAVADAARRQLGLAVGRIDMTFVAVLQPASRVTTRPDSPGSSRR